jgi:hypothetical protein
MTAADDERSHDTHILESAPRFRRSRGRVYRRAAPLAAAAGDVARAQNVNERETGVFSSLSLSPIEVVEHRAGALERAPQLFAGLYGQGPPGRAEAPFPTGAAYP